MHPNHPLDERFNLNNYRAANQRRPSVPSPYSPPQASMSASHHPTIWNLPPGTVRAPSNFMFNDTELRLNATPPGMYRNVPNFHTDMETSSVSVAFQSSRTVNPAPQGGHSTFSARTSPTIPLTHPTHIPASNSSLHHHSQPRPLSPVAPNPGRLAAQLVEKLDVLASRQDLLFTYAKEALIARQADARQQATQAQQPPAPDSSAADGLKTTAQAITALAQRMDDLAKDVSAIRDVLGITVGAPEHELSNVARYMKKRRLSKQAGAAQTGPGVPAGANPNNAIVVNDAEEGAVPREQEAGPSRLRSRPPAQRSITDRLDGMEADFAEFMERVRDPNANIDELRGLNSHSMSKPDQTHIVHDGGSRQSPASRCMRDVGISPRTPSPHPLLLPSPAAEVRDTRAADDIFGSQSTRHSPADPPLPIEPESESSAQHAPNDPHDLSSDMLVDADDDLFLSQAPTSSSLNEIDTEPVILLHGVSGEKQLNDTNKCAPAPEEQLIHSASDNNSRGERSPMSISVADNTNVSISLVVSPDDIFSGIPPLSLKAPSTDIEQDRPSQRGQDAANAAADSAPRISTASRDPGGNSLPSPIVPVASSGDTLPDPSAAALSANGKRDQSSAKGQTSKTVATSTRIPPINLVDDSDDDGDMVDPPLALKAASSNALPPSTKSNANAKEHQSSSRGNSSKNGISKRSPWIPPIVVVNEKEDRQSKGPSLALPGGKGNQVRSGSSTSRTATSTSSTTTVQRSAAPASVVHSDDDATPSPDIEPARPLKRLKRYAKSPTPTLRSLRPPPLLPMRKIVPPPIIPWSAIPPRKAAPPPPAPTPNSNRGEKGLTATPVPGALSRTASAQAGTPEQRAGEQQKPRPQWHSKPSPAALRDLSEVKIGPPRKARPAGPDVPEKGGVAPPASTSTGPALMTTTTKGHAVAAPKGKAAAGPQTDTPRHIVTAAGPAMIKRSHDAAAPRVGDVRGGVDSAKKAHRIEKRKRLED